MQLKSAQDIKRIYHSGQITGGFLREVASLVKPDTTTKELDVFAAEYFSKHKSAPAFLGYKGFPANICVSIDDEIVDEMLGSFLPFIWF